MATKVFLKIQDLGIRIGYVPRIVGHIAKGEFSTIYKQYAIKELHTERSHHLRSRLISSDLGNKYDSVTQKQGWGVCHYDLPRIRYLSENHTMSSTDLLHFAKDQLYLEERSKTNTFIEIAHIYITTASERLRKG